MFIDILGFIGFLIIGLYFPGRLFFSLVKIELESVAALFLPFTVGLLIFTLIAYILSLLHVSFFLFPTLLILSIISLVKQKLTKPMFEKKHAAPLLLSFALMALFAAIAYPTGLFGNTLFYRHDDLWHLMLIHEMLNRFPPNNPGFSGIPLHGYHFFFDFLLAQVNKYFFISVDNLYFRLFPLLLTYLWGIGVYSLAFVWSKKITVSLWSVFLTMFGGSFAYGLLLQGHKGFSWDSGLGISQPYSSLMNPPFTISIALTLTALFAVYYFFQTKKYSWLILLALTAGLTPMFKVYGGIIVMSGFCFVAAVELFRRHWKIIPVSFLVALLFFTTYWIFASGSGYLIWYPLWSPHTILQAFPWYNFDNKMYVYSTEHVIKGLFQTEVDGLTVFFLGNLGTRLIGLLLLIYFVFERKMKPSLFACMLFLLSLVGIGIPLFFIQSGKVFEIIQMSWYFLFLTSFGASFGFAYFFEKHFPKILKFLFVIAVILLTIPSAYEVFTGISQTASYNPKENAAIVYLTKDPVYTHTVLELPENVSDKTISQWYIHQEPIIATFGNKQGFVANEFIDFPGVPINERLQQLAQLSQFAQNGNPGNVSAMQQFLQKNHITYIFCTKPHNNLLAIPGVKEAFSDTSGVVYTFSY